MMAEFGAWVPESGRVPESEGWTVLQWLRTDNIGSQDVPDSGMYIIIDIRDVKY